MLYLSAHSFASCTPPLLLLQPTSDLFKTFPIGDIVDKDNPLGPSVISCGDVPEPLLASRVPDDQFD